MTSLTSAGLVRGFRKLSNQEDLGAPHRVLLASLLRIASREQDIYARASYIEGLMGYAPGGIARSYRKFFSEAQQALLQGAPDKSPIARALVEQRGLSEKEALAMVSDKNVGLYNALVSGAGSVLKSPVRGIDAEDVASSLVVGVSPVTGETMKYGPKGGVFYWLGKNAPAQISLSGVKAIAFREAANRAKDVLRGTSETEKTLVQLDAPVSGESAGVLLQDILTGDEDVLPRASFMELASLIYSDPAVMGEIDKQIRGRLGGEYQEAVWSAILADPDLLLVTPSGIGVKGEALARAVSAILGKEVLRPAVARTFKDSILPKITVALHQDSVISKALRRREVLDIIQEATRPRALSKGRTPVPIRLAAQDRSVLIRLASELPKGSAERKAILAGLRKV
jgi:hypothetical protein